MRWLVSWSGIAAVSFSAISVKISIWFGESRIFSRRVPLTTAKVFAESSLHPLLQGHRRHLYFNQYGVNSQIWWIGSMGAIYYPAWTWLVKSKYWSLRQWRTLLSISRLVVNSENLKVVRFRLMRIRLASINLSPWLNVDDESAKLNIWRYLRCWSWDWSYCWNHAVNPGASSAQRRPVKLLTNWR